ncbi:MAG: methionine--tRNA ligase [Patescibacteria group bacterium]|nr:methionine--tRNA ligase [Patescibacteria group bacterium]
MARYYLTTTLPYVNAKPHIGFALELVQADAWVRHHESLGDEVFFNTGTDEHGQKIWEAAQKEGKEAKTYVDLYAEEFKKLKVSLGLSDALSFVRTTDLHHEAAAKEMWKRCEKDIYKKEYEGLYCVGHEAFLTEKDLVDGLCPEHKTKPKLLKEKNYFFALSKYQERLIEYLSRPGVIVPEWRRLEALQFVKSGLEDFSISREKARLSWGVPVPGDDSQVMYVWFDALTSYISTLGWPEDSQENFKKFWEEGRTIQMAGKDQVRFQSIMWQAMIMSASKDGKKIKNTDVVFYHGFINSGGQKMSKSLGNVISPEDLIAKYGVDATRYLLLRHVNATEDTDITWDKLDEWYTADLVNGLGNLVARIMKLAEVHLGGPAVTADKKTEDKSLINAMAAFDYNLFTSLIWMSISDLDQQIQEEQAFALVKKDAAAGAALIRAYVEKLFYIGKWIEPAMPRTSAAIVGAIMANKKPDNLFPRLA